MGPKDSDPSQQTPQVKATREAPANVMDLETFIALHKNQLESSVVPEIFWESLYEKLIAANFDSGNCISLVRVEDEEASFVGWKVVTQEAGLSCSNPQNIFLVDHAWTFRPQLARHMLSEYHGLADRMVGLMDIQTEGKDSEEIQDDIMRELWRFAGTYCLGNAQNVEDRMPVWYIMDELGSRIQHSSTDANVRLVPFMCVLDQRAYSLLFPIRDLKENEELLRDYLEMPEAQDPTVRKALQNIWEEVDISEEIPFVQEEPPKEFFEMCRENESLPLEGVQVLPLPTDRRIKVYAEYKYIGLHLKHERFEMVEDPDEADILWLTSHFKNFKAFSMCPGKRINQFPFENVITIKDLLCVVCRRASNAPSPPFSPEAQPSWLPLTFNLKTELPKFVSYFQHRQKNDLDNHWIVKPWNLARGLDMHITNHLPHVLKLPFSGPKIAQKYIEDPVLFQRPGIGKVKFDIRYILMLESVKPLKVYAYNRFWLRFANREFNLSHFDVYEKHFTVMNYTEESELKQMFCHDFIRDFESQYPEVKWSSVEEDIFSMFKSAFKMAVSKEPPCGIGHSPQSRAMYASDLMLAWETDKVTGERRMQPKILEVNWGPDCQRACDYYPDFFNNVFSTLYLGQPEGQNVTLL